MRSVMCQLTYVEVPSLIEFPSRCCSCNTDEDLLNFTYQDKAYYLWRNCSDNRDRHSGTWIDKNPNLTTMSFVVITPQSTNTTSQTYVKIYNFQNEVFTKMAVDSLRY